MLDRNVISLHTSTPGIFPLPNSAPDSFEPNPIRHHISVIGFLNLCYRYSLGTLTYIRN